MELRQKVVNVILSFEKDQQFNLADVVIKCRKENIENRELILKTTDELYESGLIHKLRDGTFVLSSCFFE